MLDTHAQFPQLLSSQVKLNAHSEMTVRSATHAGAWYSGSSYSLGKQVDEYLKQAPGSVVGARLLIGPHAGYSYAGSTLAETYGAWDTSKVKRVFVLGPSHHVYFKQVAMLSGCSAYETPFGNIPVDMEVVSTLCKKYPSIFKRMKLDVDEDEHSFEMHCPYIYRKTEHLPQGIPSIIPIMISDGDDDFDDSVARVLAPYLEDEENTFVISSDFCHWGSRFGYRAYTPERDIAQLQSLKSTTLLGGLKIWESIEYLDTLATETISKGSSENWNEYIEETKNTVCGQHPITLLLKSIEIVTEQGDMRPGWARFKWIGYQQSSRVTSAKDSSVSYASGYAIA